MDKKFYQSKKFISWLIACVLFLSLSVFMSWRGLGWEAVYVAGMAACISGAYIIGQSFVDKVLYRIVEGVSALKGKKK